MKLRKIFASAVLLAITTTSVNAEVAVIVSRDNQIAKLDSDIIARIFQGKVSSFPNDEEAIAVDLKKGSDVRDEFGETFLGKTPSQLNTYWSRLIFTGRAKPNQEVDSATEMKKIIAKNPNMIGYIDAKDVDNTVRVIAKR